MPAIEAGVQTIMISFSSWNGVKHTGNKGLITDVLKKRMNFDGFTVGDWNAHGQVRAAPTTTARRRINAGLDMYMAPDSWRGLYDNTLKQVKDGTIPMERLDDAVTRILRVKFRAGLFEAGPPSKRPLGGDFKMLASPEQRALARDAVRQSLVLLKNNGGLLPLAANKHVLVTGDGADNIGKQSGGWTITWQGTGLNNADFPGGTSIWGGMKAAVKAAGGSAELSTDGSYKKKPDVAIVVFGENPYAEFQGDLKVLTLPGSMTQHLEIMKKLQDEKIPVVAILLSGRPLWQNRELNLANAYRRGLAAGQRGRRHRRRAVPQEGRLGELRLHRQAVVLVAARCRGRAAQREPGAVRPAVPVRLRPHLRRAARSSRRCPRIRAFPPSSCRRARSSTRACRCSRGRCGSRTAPTPRASPPCRPKRSAAA